MPAPDTGFELPTFAAIVTRQHTDWDSRLGEDSRIPRSWQWGLVYVTAGISHAVHQLAGFCVRQGIVDRATAAGVLRWGVILAKGSAPLAGTKAIGTMGFTGTVGAVITAGALLQRESDDQQFTVDAEATIGGGGSVQQNVTAVLRGSAGNDPGGTGTYQLVTPIVGIASVAGPTTALAGGSDAEDTEGRRARVMDRLRNVPHAGAAHDYRAWAKDALATVDAVWLDKGVVSDGPPLGSAVPLTLRFTLEGEGAAVIPAAGDIAVVQAFVAVRAPEGADVTAAAPTSLALNVTIDPAAAYDTAAKRAAVEDALHALCARINRARYGDVSDPGLVLPAPGTAVLYNSELRTAIGHDMEHFTLDSVQADGTGLSNVAVGITQALRLGTVTWVP